MKKQCCIDTILEIEKWMKERTFVKSSREGTNVSLVRFMPFEFEELKKELIGNK